MEVKNPILVISLLAVGLLFWWLLHSWREPSVIPPPAISANQPTPSPPAPMPPSRQVQTSAATAVTTTSEPTPESDFTAWNEKRIKQMKEALENQAEWRTPIEFYGEVVDENTNPVAGAQIDFDANDTSAEGTSFFHTQSDANGLFSIKNIQGKILGVKVSKEGYYSYAPAVGLTFWYAGANQNFVPDAGNPVVFRLRKKGTAEPLIHIAGLGLRTMRDFLLTTNGKPVNISLKDGNNMPEGQGDLQIQFWASPPQSGTRNFPWSCRISVPSGGLLPIVEQFPFLAPESGYLQAEEFTADPNSDQWNARYENTFFVRQRDGDYARVKIRVHASVSEPYFGIESYLNPTGSRNLEPAN
jgi:cytoskeletal protein RodZ